MDENEEEKENQPREMSEEKAQKIKAKMQAFMADISNDLLEDEDYQEAVKKIMSTLTKRGIPTSLTYLKAYREGYELAMGAHGIDHSTAMLMLTCISRLVAEKEIDMELKVSKSLASKPEEK